MKLEKCHHAAPEQYIVLTFGKLFRDLLLHELIRQPGVSVGTEILGRSVSAYQRKNVGQSWIMTLCFFELCKHVPSSCLATVNGESHQSHLTTEWLRSHPDTVLFVIKKLENHLK